MCYDRNWQKSGSCDCNRPPPRIVKSLGGWIVQEESAILLLEYDESGNAIGRWVYPSDLKEKGK